VTSGFLRSLKKHLTHNKEVQDDTGKQFRGQPEEFYSNGFEKFIESITSKEWEITWKNEV
jgi:hypothetical protein